MPSSIVSSSAAPVTQRLSSSYLFTLTPRSSGQFLGCQGTTLSIEVIQHPEYGRQNGYASLDHRTLEPPPVVRVEGRMVSKIALAASSFLYAVEPPMQTSDVPSSQASTLRDASCFRNPHLQSIFPVSIPAATVLTSMNTGDASPLPTSTSTVRHFYPPVRRGRPSTRPGTTASDEYLANLVGTSVVSFRRMRGVESVRNEEGEVEHKEDVFAVFGDIGVRAEGRYRLKFIVFDVETQFEGSLGEVWTTPFRIFRHQDWPGTKPRTPLTTAFAVQGVKLRRGKLEIVGPANATQKRTLETENVAEESDDDR